MAFLAKFLGVSVVLALIGIYGQAEAGKRMVCYYGGWAPYRNGNGTFVIEDIDPHICTHAIYGFAALNDDATIKVFDPWMDLPNDWGKDGYGRFNNMKKVNPELKTLIALGGWNEGSIRYSDVFSVASNRQVFVQDAVAFLKKYGFDGLDLDWEYPGQRGGRSSDKDTFSSLIQELRAEFNKHGFLLTAAVAAAEFSFEQSYNVPALNQYLDFINIMAYDYHGAWENVTGQNAPLYMSSYEAGTNFSGHNADSSMKAWIRHGAAPEKLSMGVGLYGRTFTLSSTACKGKNCPASGPGAQGPMTGEAGMLGYNEICLMEPRSQVFWDEEGGVPFLVDGTQWVGYDDERSAVLKVQYIKDNNIGGAMVWSIDTDDFRGSCGKGKYPILRILKDGMDGATGSPAPAPTAAPAPAPTAAPAPAPTAAPAPAPTAAPAPAPTAAPAPAPTAAPAPAPTAAPAPAPTAAPAPAPPSSEVSTPENPCVKEGYNRDSTNCAVFYQCTKQANGSYTYSKFTCSGALLFDTTINNCNHAAQVTC